MELNYGLAEWLGPAYDEMTEAQRERFAHEVEKIGERYPDPDEEDLRQVAMSATVQYLLGETSPEDAARELTTARIAQAQAFAAACQIGAMLVADQGGKDKSEAARRVGIDRMSLLKTLGER